MRVFWILLFVLSTASCTFSKQRGYHVQKVNGMEFSSMTLPNQLDVLVVHDPRFKKSSAAMAVAVGSLEDPESAQGLAHYLEHMLFLGTKDYPKPDEYSTFMEVNGGWDNAYTSDEVTNYMFEVDNGAIDGALQRFSRFFVSPLFDETYLEREKNAVHSEFEKNLKQDSWREDRYVNLLAKKGHPYQKFSTGNTKTLKPVTRQDVIQFYRKHYSSNNMKLVVMSTVPTATLHQMVTKYFSDVPNFNSAKPTYDDFFFDSTQKERLHFIKSIQDKDEMTILFNVPDDSKYWKSKPLTIIAKLLGDEGPGSLLSYLKNEGLALELSASDAFWRTFGIGITLTPKGRAQYLRVLAAVEKDLELIRQQGYPEYLFRDESSLRQIALENLEPSSSGGRAASFAKALIDHPAQDFLQRNYLLTEYSQEDFKTFLSFIDLKKAHILISSPKEKTSQKENIMGVEYTQTSWQLPSNQDAIPLTYPPSNPYIPTDFSLVNSQKKRGEPETLKLKTGGTVYLKTDTELGLAKASLKMIVQGETSSSPRDSALIALYVMAKDEEMREWSYPISEAGAEFQLDNGESPDEIVISLSGYSQRLPQILSDAIRDEKSKRYLNQVNLNEKVFEDMKQRFKRDLLNIDEAVAAQRLGMESKFFLNNHSVYWKKILEQLDKIKLRDVQKFAKTFFSKIYMTTVAYGNINKPAVEKMVGQVSTALEAQMISADQAQQRRFRYRVIPRGETYSVPVLGKNNNHAMLTFYNMGEWSVENHARTLVMGQLVSQPYFSELRTNQQLGYVAKAGGAHQMGFVGLNTILQSPKFASIELQKKSDLFLRDFFSKKITTLSEEELRPILTSIQNELLVTPTTLAEREAEFYQAAIKYGGRFTIRQEIAKSVESLKANNVKKFIQENFLDHRPGVLSFYYYGKGTKLDKKKLPGLLVEQPESVKWEIVSPYISSSSVRQ